MKPPLLLRALRLFSLTAVLCWGATAPSAAGAAGLPDPPRTRVLDTTLPPQQWLPQVLPAGARLLHGPVALAFGAQPSGQLLAWRTAEGGYAVVYLAPDAEDPRQQRWWWLREPQPADADIDVELRAALSLGPALSRDVVLLETYSRAAPAGGARENTGTVYRRIDDGVQEVTALSKLLAGATDAASARSRLTSAYEKVLPTVPGRLSAQFASLPWPLVELTALERLQRLRPGHPAFKTYDAANGYLETRGDAGLPGYSAALFKHADGGTLLALQKRWPERQRTWFLRQAPTSTTWLDVSAQVMPGYDSALAYVLPHHGREVKLSGSNGTNGSNGGAERTGRWRWTGQRFEAVPVAP